MASWARFIAGLQTRLAKQRFQLGMKALLLLSKGFLGGMQIVQHPFHLPDYMVGLLDGLIDLVSNGQVKEEAIPKEIGEKGKSADADLNICGNGDVAQLGLKGA